MKTLRIAILLLSIATGLIGLLLLLRPPLDPLAAALLLAGSALAAAVTPRQATTAAMRRHVFLACAGNTALCALASASGLAGHAPPDRIALLLVLTLWSAITAIRAFSRSRLRRRRSAWNDYFSG